MTASTLTRVLLFTVASAPKMLDCIAGGNRGVCNSLLPYDLSGDPCALGVTV